MNNQLPIKNQVHDTKRRWQKGLITHAEMSMKLHNIEHECNQLNDDSQLDFDNALLEIAREMLMDVSSIRIGDQKI